MKKWFKRLKNQKGMTLVELLAVVVILGIVAAIAVPAVGNIIENSKEDAHKSNALLIINAAKLGVVSGEITDAEITAGVSLEVLVDRGLIDEVPSDPFNDSATYSATNSLVKLVKKSTTPPVSKNHYVITLTGTGTTSKYYTLKPESELQ